MHTISFDDIIAVAIPSAYELRKKLFRASNQSYKYDMSSNVNRTTWCFDHNTQVRWIAFDLALHRFEFENALKKCPNSDK